jgi:hypothetical protein
MVLAEVKTLLRGLVAHEWRGYGRGGIQLETGNVWVQFELDGSVAAPVTSLLNLERDEVRVDRSRLFSMLLL